MWCKASRMRFLTTPNVPHVGDNHIQAPLYHNRVSCSGSRAIDQAQLPWQCFRTTMRNKVSLFAFCPAAVSGEIRTVHFPCANSRTIIRRSKEANSCCESLYTTVYGTATTYSKATRLTHSTLCGHRHCDRRILCISYIESRISLLPKEAEGGISCSVSTLVIGQGTV